MPPSALKGVIYWEKNPCVFLSNPKDVSFGVMPCPWPFLLPLAITLYRLHGNTAQPHSVYPSSLSAFKPPLSLLG